MAECYFETHFQVHFQNRYNFIWLQALSKNLKKYEVFAIFAFLPF